MNLDLAGCTVLFAKIVTRILYHGITTASIFFIFFTFLYHPWCTGAVIRVVDPGCCGFAERWKVRDWVVPMPQKKALSSAHFADGNDDLH